jgi:hypothetical protein
MVVRDQISQDGGSETAADRLTAINRATATASATQSTLKSASFSFESSGTTGSKRTIGETAASTKGAAATAKPIPTVGPLRSLATVSRSVTRRIAVVPGSVHNRGVAAADLATTERSTFAASETAGYGAATTGTTTLTGD